MQCPNCQSALQRAIAEQYETSRPNIDNKFHKFTVAKLPVLICQPCNQHFLTQESERLIKKAFKKYLQDNNITVYGDDLIDSYMKDVPALDQKAVRDVLSDLVFYNFGNLSVYQLRDWLQPVAAGAVEAAKKLAPDQHQPYLSVYNTFVTSFFKEERLRYAGEVWKTKEGGAND